MSRLMFLRVVAVLGLAVLVYAAYAVGLTQAQTAPSGKAAGAVVAEEGRPSLNFAPIRQGGRPFFTEFSRAKVPGGWLVAAVGTTDRACQSVVFYPDPDHKWDGNSLP